MTLPTWGAWLRLLFGRRPCSSYPLSKGCSPCLGGSWLHCGRKAERPHITGLAPRPWAPCPMGHWELRSPHQRLGGYLGGVAHRRARVGSVFHTACRTPSTGSRAWAMTDACTLAQVGLWVFWPCQLPHPPPQITSSSPSHPANSFYYPRLKALPPIARVTLVRLRQNPRAFVPPAPDLVDRGNEIMDSLSGKPSPTPTAGPPPVPHSQHACSWCQALKLSGWLSPGQDPHQGFVCHTGTHPDFTCHHAAVDTKLLLQALISHLRMILKSECPPQKWKKQ